MYEESIHTAIDIGTTKVSTIVSEIRPNGSIHVVGVGVVPGKGTKKGVVSNFEEVHDSVSTSIKEASLSSGCPIHWAYLGISGTHIESLHLVGKNSSVHYSVPVSQEDIENTIEASYPEELPEGKQLLHLIPRTYIVDGMTEVYNPQGMHALSLQVETVMVLASSALVHPIVRAVESTKTKVKRLVLGPLASGEAALTHNEKLMGAVVADIGGDTTDVAIYSKGLLFHTAVIPIGGYHFTNDLAMILRTSYPAAEKIKLDHGHALPDRVGLEEVEVMAYGNRVKTEIRRRDVSAILKERASELINLIAEQIKSSGLSQPPAEGLVITGGSANMPGLDTLARSIMKMPVRLGTPKDIEGLPPEMINPAYSTSVGILLWGIRNYASQSDHSWVNHRDRRHGPFAVRMANWLTERARKVAL